MLDIARGLDTASGISESGIRLPPMPFPKDSRSDNRVLLTEREQIFISGDEVVGLG